MTGKAGNAPTRPLSVIPSHSLGKTTKAWRTRHRLLAEGTAPEILTGAAEVPIIVAGRSRKSGFSSLRVPAALLEQRMFTMAMQAELRMWQVRGRR